MKEINLSKGAIALVDDEDFEKVSKYRWYLSTSGYAVRDAGGQKNKHRVWMHRFILCYDGELEVDHRNENKLDNQKSNLRLATHCENARNRGKQRNNTSGHKGIVWDKSRGKWYPKIEVNGKCIFIGRFGNIQDAIDARKRAVQIHHKEFAKP